MTEDARDTGMRHDAVRQAIGGDPRSVSWVLAQADTTDDAVVIAMAALLERHPRRLRRAETLATTSRDRQVVAIARAHLSGASELVNALARDHLVDYPDSLIVSWIASDAIIRARAFGCSHDESQPETSASLVADKVQEVKSRE